jgi:hypothetical protein
LIEISSCSLRLATLPNSSPTGVPWSMMRNVYSPSAGKVCTTEMPPRVPHGVPSMWCICDWVRGTLKVASVGLALRSPSATVEIFDAARR